MKISIELYPREPSRNSFSPLAGSQLVRLNIADMTDEFAQLMPNPAVWQLHARSEHNIAIGIGVGTLDESGKFYSNPESGYPRRILEIIVDGGADAPPPVQAAIARFLAANPLESPH